MISKLSDVKIKYLIKKNSYGNNNTYNKRNRDKIKPCLSFCQKFRDEIKDVEVKECRQKGRMEENFQKQLLSERRPQDEGV